MSALDGIPSPSCCLPTTRIIALFLWRHNTYPRDGYEELPGPRDALVYSHQNDMIDVFYDSFVAVIAAAASCKNFAIKSGYLWKLNKELSDNYWYLHDVLKVGAKHQLLCDKEMRSAHYVGGRVDICIKNLTGGEIVWEDIAGSGSGIATRRH